MNNNIAFSKYMKSQQEFLCLLGFTDENFSAYMAEFSEIARLYRLAIDRQGIVLPIDDRRKPAVSW
jgi:hypothetical protein